MTPEEHAAVNKEAWEKLIPVHLSGDYYDFDAFYAGRLRMRPIEDAELPPVDGTTLLQLGCHLGLEIMLLAQRGYVVAGVDLSDKAIDWAREAALKVGSSARFATCDLFDVRSHFDEKFDLVYISYGVLPYVGDLDRLATLVADCLAPGGALYIAEVHPLFYALSYDCCPEGHPVVSGYFHPSEHYRLDRKGSYVDRHDDVTSSVHVWGHTMADVVTAICDAGFRLEFLHEFPFTTYPGRDYLERRVDGTWVLPANAELPLSYSLRARRD